MRSNRWFNLTKLKSRGTGRNSVLAKTIDSLKALQPITKKRAEHWLSVVM